MATIRPASAADMEVVAQIYGHYVRHSAATFEIDPPTAGEMERRLAGIQSAGLPYLVAEVDGVVSGYAYAGPYRPRPAYRFTVEDSIYIHPDATGRGLGRLLMARLIESCEGAGSRQMVAVIGDSANAASIGLHDAFGFRHVGVLTAVGSKFGAWYDTVLMQRTLGLARPSA